MINPVEYIKSSKAELEKVSWPSRKDTIRYSALVVVVSLAVAVFFAALDFGLGQGVDVALTGIRRPAAPTTPTSQPINITPDLESFTPSSEPIKITPEVTPSPTPPAGTPEKK